MGTVIEGAVRNLTSYGAFVEIEEGIDGLCVSDMSWIKKVAHRRDGEETACSASSSPWTEKRIALGRKQLTPDPWLGRSRRTTTSATCSPASSRRSPTSVFVKLDDDLEVCYISELTDDRDAKPRTCSSRARRSRHASSASTSTSGRSTSPSSSTSRRTRTSPRSRQLRRRTLLPRPPLRRPRRLKAPQRKPPRPPRKLRPLRPLSREELPLPKTAARTRPS